MVSISLFFHMILSKKVVAFLKIMLSRSSKRPVVQHARAAVHPQYQPAGRRALSCGAGIRHVRAMSDLPISDLPMSELPKTNALELSVSELSAALKRTVEDRFGFVRVRGEISNYRGPHSSGTLISA